MKKMIRAAALLAAADGDVIAAVSALPFTGFVPGTEKGHGTKVRPEAARVRAKTDPHSPPYWRVNGPLSNLDAFKAAFQCTDGAKMVRAGAERCNVW